VKDAIDAAIGMADMVWRRALSLNDRSTPERRARFEADLRRLADGISDPTVRKYYLDDMIERMRGLAGAGRRQTRGQGYRPAAQARGRNWPRRGMQPWEVAMPASPQLKALASSSAADRAAVRRTGLVLLTLVNHPALAVEMAEEISELEIPNRELDSLRCRIIDTCAAEAGLETLDLRDHLIEVGMGAILQDLEAQARHHACWFAGVEAADRDARTGLMQLVALNRKTLTLERELKRAELRFAEDPTEENLNHLSELRNQLNSLAGTEANVEGYGEASGRPARSVS
jgi:DNA primase